MMKELLRSHSFVANPAVWILLALAIIYLILFHIQIIKSFKFENLRSKAERLLARLVILDIVVIVLVTLAIRSHELLMNLDESMFSIERDSNTVSLISKTPILVAERFDVVEDEKDVIDIKSSQNKKEYRIEKTYLQSERNE